MVFPFFFFIFHYILYGAVFQNDDIQAGPVFKKKTLRPARGSVRPVRRLLAFGICRTVGRLIQAAANAFAPMG